MDWFSWLSGTNLHPSLIYQYGVTFSRNELQQEDITYFNHEFLMSMGISIAKHRLEILKLAKKDLNSINSSSISLSKLFYAIKKCVHRFVFNNNSTIKALPVPKAETEPPIWKNQVVEKPKLPVIRTRRIAKSGPLDGRVPPPESYHRRLMKLSGPLDGRIPESLMVDTSKLRLSGPLDGNSQDRLVFSSYRSPKLYPASGDINRTVMIGSKSPRTAEPLDCNNMDKSKPIKDDDLDDKLLWAALFQDMKPT